MIKVQINYLLMGLCVLIIGVAFTAVVFSGKEITTTHFQKDEISFNYPDTWLTVNQTRESQIVAFTDPEADLNVTVNREPLIPGYIPPENFTLNTDTDPSGFKFVSHKVLDLNKTEVHKNVYQINNSGKTVQRTEMWINKNDALYSIIYTTSNMKLNEKSPEIEVLMDNLTIGNAKIAKTEFWGEISIPTQGLNWKIRKDTVNHMESVYQYPESFYPGQNGTMGLLGHHTKYSSPFGNINLLNAGDPIIITDYLSQKRYVYEVTSNGDIKADYKTNPIQFPVGLYELTMVTCYPPGLQEAAYMTHCKLKTVMPI